NYGEQQQRPESCLEGCAGKLVRSNQRLMAAYVRLMPALVQRRLVLDSNSQHSSQPQAPSFSPSAA
uniref:Translocase of inner mitochondrial membrane 10B n=1 Tax=Anolis carolinensis TaxID=28377 RepID=A0A803SVH9_ANOCA